MFGSISRNRLTEIGLAQDYLKALFPLATKGRYAVVRPATGTV